MKTITFTLTVPDKALDCDELRGTQAGITVGGSADELCAGHEPVDGWVRFEIKDAP